MITHTLYLAGRQAWLHYDLGAGTITLEGAFEVGTLEFPVSDLPELLDALHGLAMQLPPPPRACRECGCTDDQACVDAISGDPCCWVEDDLCSVCAESEVRA